MVSSLDCTFNFSVSTFLLCSITDTDYFGPPEFAPPTVTQSASGVSIIQKEDSSEFSDSSDSSISSESSASSESDKMNEVSMDEAR